MDFFRRPDRRPATFDHERILVPLLGDETVDGPALKLTSLLLTGRAGVEASLLHVIEVPFERNLDAEDERAVAQADEILARGDALLREQGIHVRTSTVQARAAGPAIVDDANELGTDLIVMGLRYKKRFGGQWDAGRTVPYVMRNSTAPVWCLRAETKELAHTT
ncbi:MAG TPA: universal stress protein [Candidatus Limnocylindrales bacterium]|jgi:nucleotide-binding universal stress UspA family protein|nr:universal stress protein [Candidatus Limnocylindrales bacterium]